MLFIAVFCLCLFRLFVVTLLAASLLYFFGYWFVELLVCCFCLGVCGFPVWWFSCAVTLVWVCYVCFVGLHLFVDWFVLFCYVDCGLIWWLVCLFDFLVFCGLYVGYFDVSCFDVVLPCLCYCVIATLVFGFRLFEGWLLLVWFIDVDVLVLVIGLFFVVIALFCLFDMSRVFCFVCCIVVVLVG